MADAENDVVIAVTQLENAISKTLDYLVPEALQEKVLPGTCVEVPLGNRKASGFVVSIKKTSTCNKLKSISKALSEPGVLSDSLFQLALWMSTYYFCPLGKVLKTMLPKGVRNNTKPKTQYLVKRKKSKQEIRDAIIAIRSKAPQQAEILECMLQVRSSILLTKLLDQTKATATSVHALEKKGLLELETVRSETNPFVNEEYFKTKPKVLRDEQKQALDAICKTLKENSYNTHLLYGITGSGKTEVYMQAIRQALDIGKGVIMLVPEVSLTPQTIQHFKARFDEKIAILHHRLSDSQRLDAWKSIQKGESKIALGARSSIFSPMPNLGLIIVDEEHEQSYKQSDDTPHYSSRDVAIMRAHIEKACCVLGSATPSIESYFNSMKKKYAISILKSRSGATMPTVHLVDMKREFEKNKGYTSFSDLLLTKIEEKRKLGEQTILFLNRRGYHTVLSCTNCLENVKCCHCDQTLTYHKKHDLLACHLCGFTLQMPRNCPNCKKAAMTKFSGVGTEKIEAMLHGIFPGISTIRIDRDTTRHKGELEMLLTNFKACKADVLIGTQMIAKGHHFPQVTLVGVLNPDSALNIPDFRSQETVFQLITQVAGRAGRGFSPGEVVIQTTLPDHSVMQHAIEQDYASFYAEEIEVRKAFGFPPFSKIVKCKFASKSDEKVLEYTQEFREAIVKKLPETYTVHPVTSPGHVKVKDFYRYQFLIRGPTTKQVVLAIEDVEKSCKIPSNVFRSIDVDPVVTFF